MQDLIFNLKLNIMQIRLKKNDSLFGLFFIDNEYFKSLTRRLKSNIFS